ncbi:MAG: GTPase HflX [Clostridia bacterium]|nr:GTPase HflX [Clostridia bacterium]
MREETIHGNITGIRESLLDKLRQLYQYQMDEDSFLPHDLARFLAVVSSSINREIAIYATRDGEIVEVCIGTDRDVELRDYRLRRNPNRLSGVRCIHTHPNGDGRLSDVDLSALRSFRYDAMCSLGVLNGEPTNVQSAFLTERSNILMDDPVRWYKVPDRGWMAQIEESDRIVGRESTEEGHDGPERAVLMGIESEESLQELARLAATAGAEVVGMFLQKRDKQDSALFIGKGRADELSRQCQALEADVCIFDEELSGIQVRNLEDMLRVKVVDRTTLILDIFAQRATSSEGKLQVELAQLTYRSTRLIGQGVVLSRLAGGIGTRGPGESQLEMNRRRIRERMNDLRRRLDAVEKQRELRRKSREKSDIPVVALVGYTNAGKSTLLNRLAGADVLAEDKLFATLDAVSRRVETDEKTPYLLVDTVGFIRKLPHTLVSAFRSTLEEAALADVLVIVSDGASDEMMLQHDTVEQVLKDLGATEQPRLEVINKCDCGKESPLIPGAIHVSAKTGEGIDELNRRLAAELQKTHSPVTFFLPFAQYGALAQIRPLGRVVNEEYTDEGVKLTIVLASADRDRIISKYGSAILAE